jgi:hypothetical protein
MFHLDKLVGGQPIGSALHGKSVVAPFELEIAPYVPLRGTARTY